MKTLEEMQSLDRQKAAYVPVDVPELTPEQVQWFRDSKFGMFIHWGVYSMLGKGEWVMFREHLDVRAYEKLADDFAAPKFDARAWAKTAKAAGMKYMVLTARHHDGFCLFDSQVSDFKATRSAADKDFIKEYVEACREEGLKVGLYYSPLDWRFPGYFFPEMYWESAQAMKKQCWDQVRELCTNYGKIDMLWFDGEWLAFGGMDWSAKGWYRDPDWMKSKFWRVNYFWESEKLIRMVRELQPGIMVNNRCGWKGDFHVRERRVDNIRTDKPWDANDCIAESWGYIPGKPVLSLVQLVKNLVAIVVRDGNYLLNVGPTGEGDMEQRQVDKLAQLGQWLAQYGESIYNTRGGPILPDRWGGATYRGNTVYVHILEFTEDKIVVPAIQGNPLVRVGSLTSDKASVVEKDGMLEMRVPVEDRNLYDTILKLEFAEEIRWEGVSEVENDAYGLADGL